MTSFTARDSRYGLPATLKAYDEATFGDPGDIQDLVVRKSWGRARGYSGVFFCKPKKTHIPAKNVAPIFEGFEEQVLDLRKHRLAYLEGRIRWGHTNWSTLIQAERARRLVPTVEKLRREIQALEGGL